MTKRDDLLRRARRLQEAAIVASDPTCREMHLRNARKLIHKSYRLYAMLPASPVVDCKAAIVENRIPERFYPVNVGVED